MSLDPYETKNLATDPAYRSTLKDLRILLKEKLLEENDLGFYPECVWLEQGEQNPTSFGKKNKDKIKNTRISLIWKCLLLERQNRLYAKH